MKITIAGAHRTGKTTLVEKLQEALPGYVSRAESYYELEEAGFAFSEEPVIENYLALLEHSIEQITSDGDNIIFDRCPIDYLAYIQAVNDSGDFNMQSLFKKVLDAMTEIDILIFVAIENPDRIGCPESELPALRRKVNDLLNESVREFGSKVIKVAGSASVRRDQVIKQLSKI